MSGHVEVDHDGARLALLVFDGHAFAIARAELVQQGQWVVVVHKAHGLAGLQCVEGAEDGCVAKALGNASGVKRVETRRRQVQVCV